MRLDDWTALLADARRERREHWTIKCQPQMSVELPMSWNTQGDRQKGPSHGTLQA